MRNLRTHLAAAVALSSLACVAQAGANESENTGGGNGPGAAPNAPPATEAPKLYSAIANLKSDPKAEDKFVTFVVEAADYKTAWERARALTRFGDAHALEQGLTFYTDKTKGATMKMAPGQYTVHKVESLQQRSAKQEPVTIDKLEAALKDRNVRIPKDVQAVLDAMRSGDAEAPAAAQG